MFIISLSLVLKKVPFEFTECNHDDDIKCDFFLDKLARALE